MKGIIHQEDLTIVNLYAFNNRASKYMKKKIDRIKRKNSQFHNYIKRLEHPSVSKSEKKIDKTPASTQEMLTTLSITI